MSIWTPERIAQLDLKQLRNLRQNAAKNGASEIVDACDAEINLRSTKSQSKTKSTARVLKRGDFVSGYHFVCAADRGVIDNKDGTFWTGSWVVARQRVDDSLRFGAYVALHENKNELSYRQGNIVEYRLRERDMVDKENVGIEFKVASVPQPQMWCGGGSGEKGYVWSSISSLSKANKNPE